MRVKAILLAFALLVSALWWSASLPRKDVRTVPPDPRAPALVREAQAKGEASDREEAAVVAATQR